MSSTRAFLYPSCYPRHRSASLASIFLAELLVLAPSEDSVEVMGQELEINSMRVKPVLASPLGDRLDDFKNGLKALEAWGEQLGLGGNTGFETLYSAIETSENEDIQGIIGAIRGGKKEDMIMASRVFLRLSMDADQRMDQLDRELERVEEDQDKISQLVEGLKEAEAGKGPRGCFIEPLNRPRERLKAWTRIFFSGSSQESFWPLGESIAIKDLMDAAYESLSGGRAPLETAAIEIPFHTDSQCAQVGASEIRPLFAKLLELISRERDASGQDKEVSALSEDIQRAVEKNCGTASHGCQARMVISLYPGHSWQDVLLKAAGLGPDDVDATASGMSVPGSLFLV